MLKHILFTPVLPTALLLQGCYGGNKFSANSMALIRPADEHHVELIREDVEAVLATWGSVEAEAWSVEMSVVDAPDPTLFALCSLQAPAGAETATTVTVHSPEQIRAAYQAPTLMDDLNCFATQFRLPGCVLMEIPLAVLELQLHELADGCKIIPCVAVGGGMLRYDNSTQTAYESLWSRSEMAFGTVFPRPTYHQQLGQGSPSGRPGSQPQCRPHLGSVCGVHGTRQGTTLVQLRWHQHRRTSVGWSSRCGQSAEAA